MITDAQYQRWLESPAENRVMLAELEHSNGTVQVADLPYLAPVADDLADPTYIDVLVDTVGISTRIDGLIEIGDITLRNDGELDEWLGYQFRGYSVRLLLGDMRWSRTDFRVVATAINAGIQSARRGRIVMRVTDSSAALDEPIATGELSNGGGPVPLLLGRVFNVPATRDRTDTLHYRASYLPLVSVTARDIGNIVPMTADLPGGGFTLDNRPGSGSQITAEVHERHDIPMSMLQWVANHYGYEIAPATSLPDVAVGYYSNGETSGRRILDALANSLGGAWFVDALGRIDMRVIDAPPAEPDAVISSDDVQDGRLELSEMLPPWSALTLMWGRNHAPLRSVAAPIDQDAPALAARYRGDWRESRAEQSLPDYPLADSEHIETLLQIESDVAAERERRLAYHATRREYYRLTTYLATHQLHQAVMIEVPPLTGRVCRIVAVAPKTGGKSDIEVML